MPNIRKSMLQFIMSGSYMKRWNDKLRPSEFYEVDKQAHKMIVAFALAELHAESFSLAEKQNLHAEIVENGLFDYLSRLVVTDIKPQILQHISSKEDEYNVLAEWVIAETERYLRPLSDDFWQKYCARVYNPKKDSIANRILSAAHVFASSWEYELIRPLNVYDIENKNIGKDFDEQLDKFSDIDAVKMLRDKKSALHKFATLCGQLRFQKRWSQVPRIPETSVLGHMFIVGSYAYCFSIVEGACTARCINNFYAGLFHDLPELLTRDIISPVKRSTERIAGLIKQYEDVEMQSKVFMPLEKAGLTSLLERLKYYLGSELGSEFKESIVQDSKVQAVSFKDLSTIYNDNRFDPKDGALLKTCDILAAFIEAYTSIHNGIGSEHLREALWRMRAEQIKKPNFLINTLLPSLYADFD